MPDPDSEDAASVDDDDDVIALENDAEVSSAGSLDSESATLEHDDDDVVAAPATGFETDGAPVLRQ